MSSKHTQMWHVLGQRFIALLATLLVPLIISFIMYTVASGLGASGLPTVGYGLMPACSSNGVAYFWAVSGCNAIGSTDPSFPAAFLLIGNRLLYVVVFGVVLAEAYQMVPMIEALHDS